MANTAPQTLAIYIHWPYCTRICPYCDFNVYKTRDTPDLLPAILKDLKLWREWSGPRMITSVHLGGGTPSLMSPENISDTLSHINRLWAFPENPSLTEIALEANPSDYEPSKWRAFQQAGINRLSLGVQSFNRATLEFLGRDHDDKAARKAAHGAREIFPSLSLDLIFGYANQTQAELTTDIGTALEFEPNHLSTYQLTIEEGTAFAKAQARGKAQAVSSDISADYFETICAKLLSAGFEHYEVSNFAKAGHKSRHNLAYWTGEDYVGVGPGAHGRLTHDTRRFATLAHKRPSDYIAGRQNGFHVKTALTAQDWADEYVLMGLRITDGISPERYLDISGQALDETALKEFTDAGLLTQEGARLYATPQGRLVLNYITQKLLGG